MRMSQSVIGRSRRGAGFAARVLLLAVVLVAVGVMTVWAGSDGRKGTQGALELRLPVGPRGTALGGAVTADATGVEALFFNPSGLAVVKGTEVMFTNTSYIADMHLNYAALATNLKALGVLAFSAKVLSVGDIIVTTEDAPEGTGEVANPTFATLGVAWAKQFTDRVNFGFTAHLVNEHILEVTANGLAFDFGVQYMTGWNGLQFGVAMKNFGTSMEFSGPGFENSLPAPTSDPTASNRVFSSSSASFEMPSYFTLGASYIPVRNATGHMTLLAQYQSNNFGADCICGAAEWIYRDAFALRGSYFGTIRETPDPVTGESTVRLGTGDDVYAGYALGGGAKMRVGETKMGVDVSWRPVRDFFDDTVEFGLKVEF